MASIVELAFTRNLGSPRSFDEAATLDFDLPPNEQLARWRVVRVHIVETIGELSRCDVLLARRERTPSPPTSPQSNFFDRAKNNLQDVRDDLSKIDPFESPFDQALEDFVDDPFNPARQAALQSASRNYWTAWNNAGNTAIGEGGDLWDDAVDTFGNWDQFQQDVLGIPAAGPPWVPDAPPQPAEFLGTLRSVRIVRRTARDGEILHGRWVTGIVSEMEDVGLLLDGHRLIRLQIVPQLWKLSLRRDHRVFPPLDAISIVERVISDARIYPSSFDVSEVGTRPPARQHCIQYGETDLELVQRVLAEEGLVTIFEHQKGVEQLRIVRAEDVARGRRARSLDENGEVPEGLVHSPFANSDEREIVWSWHVRRKLAPIGASERSFNFSDVTEPASAKEQGAFHATPTRAREGWHRVSSAHESALPNADELTLHHYPAHRSPIFDATEAMQRDQVDLAHQAQLALARARLRALTASGFSNATSVTAGQVADVVHTLPEMPSIYDPALQPWGTFVITRVEALAESGLDQVGIKAEISDLPRRPSRFPRSGAIDFRAYLEGVPAAPRPGVDPGLGPSAWYVPTRVRPPRIAGTQSVIVQAGSSDPGPDGQRIAVDEIGRVSARFMWDRRPNRPESYPIRVASPWAGTSFGATFLPREGMELVVAFVDGDPEQAVAIGAVYNRINPAPRERPHLEVVEKQNHLEEKDILDEKRLHYDLEDAMPPGDDRHINMIRTRTHRGPNGKKPERARGFHELSFDDSPSRERVRIHSEGALRTRVEHDHEIEVGRDQTLVVQGNHREDVGGEQELTVEGNRRKHVIGHEMEIVAQNRSELVHGARTLSVKKDHTVRIGKDETTEVGKTGTPSERKLVVEGDRTTTVENGNDECHVKVNVDAKVHGTYALSGKTIKLVGQKPGAAAGLEATEDKLAIKADGKAELIAPGPVRLTAKKTSIKGARAIRVEAGSEVSLTLDEKGIKIVAPAGFTITCGGSRIVAQDGIRLEVNDASAPDPEQGTFLMSLVPKEGQYPAPAQIGLVEGPGILLTGTAFLTESLKMVRLDAKKVEVQNGEGTILETRKMTREEFEQHQSIEELEKRIEELRKKLADLDRERDERRARYLSAVQYRELLSGEIRTTNGTEDEVKKAVSDLEEARRWEREANGDVYDAQQKLNEERNKGKDTSDEEQTLKAAERDRDEAREAVADGEANLDKAQKKHGGLARDYATAVEEEEEAGRALTETQNEIVATEKELREKQAELKAKKKELAASEQAAAE